MGCSEEKYVVDKQSEKEKNRNMMGTVVERIQEMEEVTGSVVVVERGT